MKKRKADPTRKMSKNMKEMAWLLLRNPDVTPSWEAANVVLFFASMAWNESVGLDLDRDGYRNHWEDVEADNPALWNELKLNDTDAIIDGLVAYKKARFPDDWRRILICVHTSPSTIHVECLPPAAPGVDAKWEIRLYGLVRIGQREQAVRFLQETRKLPRDIARMQVAKIAMELGMV